MKYLALALCLILTGCDDDDAYSPTNASSSYIATHHEPVDSAVVPEPATYALILFGVLLLAYRKATA